MAQVDRTKKPSVKIPDEEEKTPQIDSPTTGKELISNGRFVPDRSTKPPLDAKPGLTEDEKTRVQAKQTSLLEKNKQDKELEEKQHEEQREKLRREKQEEEREAQEEQEEREDTQKAREGREEEEQASSGPDEKPELEKAHHEQRDAKKPTHTATETPETRKTGLDKIAANEKAKVTRTPEAQRHKFAQESRAAVKGDSVSSKVRSAVMTQHDSGQCLMRTRFLCVGFGCSQWGGGWSLYLRQMIGE